MAARSSGRPAAGVYLWLRGSAQAAAAAATMWAGVGKSGSPAPKPTTSWPAACSALALAATAQVGDSVMLSTRREMRLMPPMVARRPVAVLIVSAWPLCRRGTRATPKRKWRQASGVGRLRREVGEVLEPRVVGED